MLRGYFGHANETQLKQCTRCRPSGKMVLRKVGSAGREGGREGGEGGGGGGGPCWMFPLQEHLPREQGTVRETSRRGNSKCDRSLAGERVCPAGYGWVARERECVCVSKSQRLR